MEKIRPKIRRVKKKPVDVAQIIDLMQQADVSFYMIENYLKLGKGTVSRGVKEGTDRPIPPKWELPILKYLRKKISEHKDAELQTDEVKIELGLPVEEKQSDLKEDLKENKRGWVTSLCD